jgi:NCAIR mutase (PurE)-related protein
LVSNPWRPGTLNSLLNDFVDCPTVAMPTIVTTIQNAATHRLCASTHHVIEVIIARSLPN